MTNNWRGTIDKSIIWTHLGFILIDLVSSNAYSMQITYGNPWFLGIWIDEQSMETGEQKGKRNF